MPAPAYGAPYSNIYYRQKSAGIAILLAFLIPGAGHIYAGKLARGLLFMVAYYGLFVAIFSVWFALMAPMSGNFGMPIYGNEQDMGIVIFTIIMSIVVLVIWTFQLIDAYNVTKRYNAELMATGREPW